MDFMQDGLDNGRSFRTFNIMDDYNRELLCIYANYSITSKRVVAVLKHLVQLHGYPQRIRVDNGPEFTAYAFKDWCKAHNISIDYIQPGKPVQNAYIERLNRLYREDVLDAWLFENLNEVRIKTDQWVEDYNNNHPHSSLMGMSPNQFKNFHSGLKPTMKTISNFELSILTLH